MTDTKTDRAVVANSSSFKDKFNAFAQTFWGKVTLSAARAFVGVFIAAQAQLFTALTDVVNQHSNFGTLKSLVLALAVAGVTAAIRAVQHAVFEK